MLAALMVGLVAGLVWGITALRRPSEMPASLPDAATPTPPLAPAPIPDATAPAQPVPSAPLPEVSAPVPPLPPALEAREEPVTAAKLAPVRSATTSETAAPTAPAPRIVIHHSTGSPASAERSRALATALRAAGAEVAAILAVPVTIRRPSVRYFFAADANAGRRIADIVGSRLRPDSDPEDLLIDLRSYATKPRPGTLEVWVPAT